jgi:hypothetical protein
VPAPLAALGDRPGARPMVPGPPARPVGGTRGRRRPGPGGSGPHGRRACAPSHRRGIAAAAGRDGSEPAAAGDLSSRNLRRDARAVRSCSIGPRRARAPAGCAARPQRPIARRRLLRRRGRRGRVGAVAGRDVRPVRVLPAIPGIAVSRCARPPERAPARSGRRR